MHISHDYHMHSTFSCDCRAPMADMCQAALAQGIPEIGFSEHYDLHPGESCRDWLRPAEWYAEVERCRAEFAGRLIVRAGIEIGEPHLFPAESRAMLGRLPFDYALGSLHWVGNESVFDLKTFQTRPADEFWPLFYQELEQMTRTGGFDILSHFDVPIRTACAVYGPYAPPHDPTSYQEYIRPVLQNCVEQGIALDLNTKALLHAAHVMTPGLDILRWYVELGGERVTLGSDAHRPDHVGKNLGVALTIAQAAGLKYVTHFEQRQAKLVPIAA